MTARSCRSTVHLLAGLNAVGKTTYARRLAADLPAVRFTLDEWMLRLYALRFDDPAYPERAARCQELIWDTAVEVLDAGSDVVLDWNQWSRERRAFWRDRAQRSGHDVVLHHIQATVDTAVRRAAARSAAQQQAATAGGDPLPVHDLDEAAVRHLAELFEMPDDAEGLQIRSVPTEE